MKISFLLFCLLFSARIFAQNQHYTIKVKVVGGKQFKNIFLYRYNDSLPERRDMSLNSASFSGAYIPVSSSGGLPSAIIVLSDNDNISKEEMVNNDRNIRREFKIESDIKVLYDGERDSFSVKGGALNSIQDVFAENEKIFIKKRDSLYAEIDSEHKDVSIREREKKKARRQNYQDEKSACLLLIKNNITSVIALDNFFLFAMVPIKPVAEIRAVYDLFPEDIRLSKRGRLTDSLIKTQESFSKSGLNMGARMPDFELRNTKDEMVKSTAFFGRYTLIDFWASWCTPCRAESPALRKAYEQFHKRGFNIISISIDVEKDKNKWKGAIEKDKIQNFVNLFNPGGSVGIAKELGINAIPANYLLDKEGKVIGINLRGEQLTEKLKSLFDNKN